MTDFNPGVPGVTTPVAHIHNVQVGTHADGTPIIEQVIQAANVEALLTSLLAALAPAAAVSLTAVAASPANGANLQLTTPKASVSMQVTLTGGPATATVDLQGSLDGASWSTLGTWSVATLSSGDILTITSTPALYWRARLTALTGGTSPTVTAKIAAA